MKINCNYMSLSTFITRIGHKNKNTLYTRHAREITSRRNVPSVNQCGSQSINWTRSRSMHFLLPNKHFRWIQSKAPQIAHTNWWVCVCNLHTVIYISHYTYVYTYHGWAYVFRLNAAFSLWFITAFWGCIKTQQSKCILKWNQLNSPQFYFFHASIKYIFNTWRRGGGKGDKTCAKRSSTSETCCQ